MVQILLRWRGSVYKLIYKELLAYIVMYMIINLTYRHGANLEFHPHAKFLVPEAKSKVPDWETKSTLAWGCSR
jgi:hypothetical protein